MPLTGRPPHEPDRASPRPPDPRQPGQPDGRGGGGAALGAHGHAAVPSGASTGEFEATELRDGGKRWAGKGVTRAVAQRQRRDRRRRSTGMDAADQAALDRALIELDGTPNKSRLGANAILGVSLAAAHAQAAEEGLPLWRYLGGEAARVLPVPMMNVLNGGAHADNKVDFQEFMIVPCGAPTLLGVPAHGRRGLPRAEAHAARARPRHRRRRRGRLRARPRAPTRRRWRCSSRASRRPATGPGEDVAIALDPATSEIYRDGCLRARARGPHAEPRPSWPTTGPTSPARYPIVSIEDGMDEEDWDGWKTLTERLGASVQLVGDDLFVTNTERLRRGIEAGRGQLDPDQGQPDRHADARRSQAIAMAREAGYTAVMSHRSGETEDVTIADLAVATGCGQIKTGAPSRSDRVAKYNQLLRIEEQLGRRRRVPRPGSVFAAR